MSQIPADPEPSSVPEVAPLAPPSERVQELIDELELGQHAHDVTDLVGDLFEVPPHVFLRQHPEARALIHRAVAEAISHPRTTVEGSPGYEEALDLLHAGYVQAGRGDLAAAEQALGAQARAIAQAMTFAATTRPAADPNVADAPAADDTKNPPVPEPAMEPLKVYCTPHCQSCNATVRSLEKAGVPFEKIELEDLGPQEYQAVVAGHTTAPVVHAPGVGVWSGHRPTQLDQVIAQRANIPGPNGPAPDGVQ
jgi:glutaredoxin-like protein NrdH